MSIRDRRTLRAVTALVFLIAGLALAGCAPSPGTAECRPVASLDGATAAVPVTAEGFAADCSTGGTVTLWVDAAGPVAGSVFEPIAYPVTTTDADPAPRRGGWQLVGQSSDNPDCEWRTGNGDLWLHCDTNPTEPFLTSVTVDLGATPGVVGLSGVPASTLRGIS